MMEKQVAAGMMFTSQVCVASVLPRKTKKCMCNGEALEVTSRKCGQLFE
jgi:hypothetical protein